MGSEQIEAAYNQLKGLTQYKNFSHEELRQLAIQKVKEDEVNIEELFVHKQEKKLAKTLLKKYLSDFTIETISDINILRDVIFLELVNQRFRNKINELYEADNAVPVKIIEIIHKNLEEILKLKQALGITREKDQANQTDAFKSYDLLMQRAKKWRSENQATRSISLPFKCPKCGEVKPRPILLKIRTDAWEAQNHSFFQDRILGNTEIIRLYKAGKLNAEEVARIFETSTDYVSDWLLDKWKTTEAWSEKKDAPSIK